MDRRSWIMPRERPCVAAIGGPDPCRDSHRLNPGRGLPEVHAIGRGEVVVDVHVIYPPVDVLERLRDHTTVETANCGFPAHSRIDALDAVGLLLLLGQVRAREQKLSLSTHEVDRRLVVAEGILDLLDSGEIVLGCI